MNVNNEIKTILKNNSNITNLVDSRIDFQKNQTGKYPAITFFCYNELGGLFAGDKEVLTGYYIQIDIWSKGDYSELANEVLMSMRNAGFRRTSAADLYESDVDIFHKAMRFLKEEI